MPNKNKHTKNEVDIHEFPIHEMKSNSKIVIIGKPATGKSTVIRDIVKAFRHIFPVAKVFSGTEENNHFYAQIFPELFIHSEYNEKEMEDFAKRQKLAMRNNPNNPKGLLIVDDCSDDPKFFHRPLFQKFYKNGRQWDMMFILALQYGMDIRPVIRTNIDYVFIFREPNERNRKALHENYAGIIGSYADFCDVMDQLTEDYTALVIDNRKQSNDLSDCVYYYKARLHDDFNFGSLEYCQWANQRYNTQYVPPVL
uniref:Packaging ATPase n=1 Tax=Marseillevirus LCMAC202 TaxID=2506606 RepID=A0A481YY13_9VIRU|nr:MAG: packaging ATPase [Marseillevirus LCMAC202]